MCAAHVQHICTVCAARKQIYVQHTYWPKNNHPVELVSSYSLVYKPFKKVLGFKVYLEVMNLTTNHGL